MVLVAGPYRSGTNDDPALIEANMQAMNQAALDVFRAGHLGISGEAVADEMVAIAKAHGKRVFYAVADLTVEA